MSSRACLINRVGVKVVKSNLAKHVEANNKQSSDPSKHKPRDHVCSTQTRQACFSGLGAIAHDGTELLPRMQEAWFILPKSNGEKKKHIFL